MYDGKLGVGIMSFNRPNYLGKLVDSLCQNTHLKNTDFHLYQDGSIDRFTKKPITDNEKINKCVDLFDASSLPNKNKYIRKENVSIAINQFEAYEGLTSNYEYVLILEDDLILSPHYLRLIRVLIKQFENEDGVFSVSLNFRRCCEPADVSKRLDQVTNLKEHWWAECFSSKKWQLIRPHFLKYYELVKNVYYHERPREPILQLFREMNYPTHVSSQDAAKEASVICCGLKRINTVVNRGIYIGEHGVHFRPEIFRKLNFHNQEPYIFPEDKDIKEFKLV